MDITHQLNFKLNFVFHSSNHGPVRRVGDLRQAAYHWLGTHHEAVIYFAVVQSVVLLFVVSEVKVPGGWVLRDVAVEEPALVPALGVGCLLERMNGIETGMSLTPNDAPDEDGKGQSNNQRDDVHWLVPLTFLDPAQYEVSEGMNQNRSL